MKSSVGRLSQKVDTKCEWDTVMIQCFGPSSSSASSSSSSAVPGRSIPHTPSLLTPSKIQFPNPVAKPLHSVQTPVPPLIPQSLSLPPLSQPAPVVPVSISTPYVLIVKSPKDEQDISTSGPMLHRSYVYSLSSQVDGHEEETRLLDEMVRFAFSPTESVSAFATLNKHYSTRRFSTAWRKLAAPPNDSMPVDTYIYQRCMHLIRIIWSCSVPTKLICIPEAECFAFPLTFYPLLRNISTLHAGSPEHSKAMKMFEFLQSRRTMAQDILTWCSILLVQLRYSTSSSSPHVTWQLNQCKLQLDMISDLHQNTEKMLAATSLQNGSKIASETSDKTKSFMELQRSNMVAKLIKISCESILTTRDKEMTIKQIERNAQITFEFHSTEDIVTVSSDFVRLILAACDCKLRHELLSNDIKINPNLLLPFIKTKSRGNQADDPPHLRFEFNGGLDWLNQMVSLLQTNFPQKKLVGGFDHTKDGLTEVLRRLASILYVISHSDTEVCCCDQFVLFVTVLFVQGMVEWTTPHMVKFLHERLFHEKPDGQSVLHKHKAIVDWGKVWVKDVWIAKFKPMMHLRCNDYKTCALRIDPKIATGGMLVTNIVTHDNYAWDRLFKTSSETQERITAIATFHRAFASMFVKK